MLLRKISGIACLLVACTSNLSAATSSYLRTGFFGPSTVAECVAEVKNTVIWAGAMDTMTAACFYSHVDGWLNEQPNSPSWSTDQKDKIKAAGRCYYKKSKNKEILSRTDALSAAKECAEDALTYRALTERLGQ